MRKLTKRELGSVRTLANMLNDSGLSYEATVYIIGMRLGRVDKRDSPGAVIVIQAGICNGDQRGTKPDVERRVGVL
ncbi:hypothetical protein LO749_17250 [Paracoccus denitrificans]|uniref:hypothetical protein n=1 Tax=Paracoccus denitrificans TaxID=266 RepID=UPI001E4E9627|nr:hypothetical protein [Paracoccus denitrificans]UFS66272.1 hypothetical protein LO749_17250 [Paracoccus denitrificans]